MMRNYNSKTDSNFKSSACDAICKQIEKIYEENHNLRLNNAIEEKKGEWSNEMVLDLQYFKERVVANQDEIKKLLELNKLLYQELGNKNRLLAHKTMCVKELERTNDSNVIEECRLEIEKLKCDNENLKKDCMEMSTSMMESKNSLQKLAEKEKDNLLIELYKRDQIIVDLQAEIESRKETPKRQEDSEETAALKSLNSKLRERILILERQLMTRNISIHS